MGMRGQRNLAEIYSRLETALREEDLKIDNLANLFILYISLGRRGIKKDAISSMDDYCEGEPSKIMRAYLKAHLVSERGESYCLTQDGKTFLTQSTFIDWRNLQERLKH